MSESDLIFICVFNLGGIDLALNHLESLKRQNIKNYCAYVLDKESYNIVKNNGYNTELLLDTDVTTKLDFGTNQFNTLSYYRYDIILKLLKQNKTVWYLDIDTVVLQNLNKVYDEIIRQNNKPDIIMQDDINMPCTGCLLSFPTKKTIDVMEYVWSKRSTNNNDQIELMLLLRTYPTIATISLLNPMQFPNGLLYFNEPSNNKYYKEIQNKFYRSNDTVYFVHANWMVGINTKIEALKKKNLWFI
jgi:hypothetical protein